MSAFNSDFFRTAAGPAEVETRVLGSRFLARVWPVRDEEEIQRLLASLRKREYDATHHCSAYRLGPDADRFRADDDGEPSGTAGQPILRQIEARDLTDTLVVVTRWYGGTKLGTGGLIRAYGEAASLALDASGIETHTRRLNVRATFDYADTSPALHTISKFDAVTCETRYGDRTTLVLEVRCSQLEPFLAAFQDALSGRGETELEAER